LLSIADYAQRKGEFPAMDIMTGLAAAAKALEIVKQLREVDKQLNQAEFKLKIAELYSSLADVKMSLADAKEELATKNKLDRYRLRDCGEQTFVYELKTSEVSEESPQHRICGACYQQGKIGHLQFEFRSSDSGREKDWYECSVCKDRRPYGATPSNSFSN
jgi:CRISPR/Cas system-associated protein Cas10 (large subunit of type III CRISPR-Cas system)